MNNFFSPWTKKQRGALNQLYSTILLSDDGNFNLEEKYVFWKIYNGHDTMQLYFNKFLEIGVSWSLEEKKKSYIILNEYQWLYKNNHINF